MKRHRNLYEGVCSCENLAKAFNAARKGKRQKQYVIEFEENLEENLKQIHKELVTESWQPKPYKRFIAYDPKKRQIHAPVFRDRIVQHALMQVLEPIFDNLFIFDSYASRKGKGTHIAADRLTTFLRRYNGEVFVFKSDVKKFFENINHDVLMALIRKKIADEKVIRLILKIIKNDGIEKGLTLGNYTSQWFANIVLNELDYFVKHELKVKEYIRYMDDFAILAKSKEELHIIKHKIKAFLEEALKLELHKRKQWIFPASIGIDFLGYVIWQDHRRLRKRNIKRFINRLKIFENREDIPEEHIKGSLMSWKGYSQHADTWELNHSLIKKHSLVSIIYE